MLDWVFGVTPAASHDGLDTLRGWLAVGSTLLAVVVALYVGAWRERWRRPSLSLKFDPPKVDRDGERSTDLTASHEQIDGRPDTAVAWVRFRVANKQGKATAENVEVLLLSVRDAEGRALEDRGSLGDFALIWSNSFPEATKSNVPPGVERHVDLLRVAEPPRAQSPELELAILPRPADERHRLSDGSWTIRLVLAAGNADASTWETTVAFDGDWDFEDMWDSEENEKHLIVSLRRV